MAAALRGMGVTHTELEDGMAIYGTGRIRAFSGDSWGDHRVAMSLIVAALAAQGESCISNASCMDISFPGFMETLTPLMQKTC
jgi:3-phosphoshikimate 1-carboxyvinyltransferase